MSDTSFSSQTIEVPNPFRPYALARLATGFVVTVTCACCLVRARVAVSSIFSTGRLRSEEDLALVILGIMGLFWLIWGLICVASGVRRLGRLVVPPRTPADLGSLGLVETVLVRREFDELRIPKDGPLAWIQRYFSDRVVFGTPREFRLLEQSIRSIRFALLATIFGGVVAYFALPRLQGPSGGWPPSVTVPLGLIGLAVLGSAGLRAIAIPLLLPARAPLADRLEQTRVIRGGGDPASLQPMIEQEFLRLRLRDIPNRVLREMGHSAGTVKDTGNYAGRLVIETQPVAESLDRSSLTWLYFGGGVAAAVGGMAIVISGLFNPTVAAVFGDLAAAIVWTSVSSRLTASGLIHVSRFRFRSVVALVQAEGTIGRSEVKAGKAWNDSFESSNLVVRSDSVVRLHAASIVTEAYSIDGRRYIVWTERGSSADEAMQTASHALDAFEKAGIVVRPIEASQGGLNQIAQANLAYRKAAAEVEASPPPLVLPGAAGTTSAVPTTAEPLTLSSPSSDRTASQPVTSDTKACPMCAETIKAAARKCRFCGHMFEG